MRSEVTWADWLEVAGSFCLWGRLVWVYAAMPLRLFKEFLPPKVLVICRFIYHEGKPFYWPMQAVTMISMAARDTPIWAQVANLAVYTYLWWAYKDIDDDDDRWKRRKKKLTEAVKRVGGKLIVAQPATSRA